MRTFFALVFAFAIFLAGMSELRAQSKYQAAVAVGAFIMGMVWSGSSKAQELKAAPVEKYTVYRMNDGGGASRQRSGSAIRANLKEIHASVWSVQHPLTFTDSLCACYAALARTQQREVLETITAPIKLS